MGLFLVAGDIGGLILARVVQGVATGIASGALGAARGVVEAAPARKRASAWARWSPACRRSRGLAVGALLDGHRGEVDRANR